MLALAPYFPVIKTSRPSLQRYQFLCSSTQNPNLSILSNYYYRKSIKVLDGKRKPWPPLQILETMHLSPHGHQQTTPIWRVLDYLADFQLFLITYFLDYLADLQRFHFSPVRNYLVMVFLSDCDSIVVRQSIASGRKFSCCILEEMTLQLIPVGTKFVALKFLEMYALLFISDMIESENFLDGISFQLIVVFCSRPRICTSATYLESALNKYGSLRSSLAAYASQLTAKGPLMQFVRFKEIDQLQLLKLLYIYLTTYCPTFIEDIGFKAVEHSSILVLEGLAEISSAVSWKKWHYSFSNMVKVINGFKSYGYGWFRFKESVFSIAVELSPVGAKFVALKFLEIYFLHLTMLILRIFLKLPEEIDNF
ncbi:hypothetical protein GQ457_03G034670 [Hibiscus cannabinus]